MGNKVEGYKAKELKEIASKCFDSVVGEVSNQRPEYHSHRDVIFIMNILNGMVDEYLKAFMVDREMKIVCMGDAGALSPEDAQKIAKKVLNDVRKHSNKNIF